MPNLPWRSPDKPIRTYSLNSVREGDYLVQKKIDGYCAVIIKDSGITVLSRHQKPLKVSNNLLKQIDNIGMSDGDVFIGEWTGLRKANREESLYLFGVLYLDYEWLGSITEQERYQRLLEKIKPHEDIKILESHDCGYADLYRSTVDDWKTEGLVLKRKDARLIGNREKCVKNPAFNKLKWRDGSGADVICTLSDEDLVCAS